MSLQVYCVVDKCHWSNEPTQFFVVSPSLEDALTAFRHNFAAPHSKYNLAATPAEVETSLQLELSTRTGQWDKVGYLKLRVNRDIPKTLPVFVTSLQPNMVFN